MSRIKPQWQTTLAQCGHLVRYVASKPRYGRVTRMCERCQERLDRAKGKV